MLDADIGLRLGDLDLEVELGVRSGEVVALLGPNGAGKTTVVRALAGLLAVERGRIEIDGRLVDDPATGVFVPAERRSVGVVFQDHLLFPRMSALDNVAFGLRARGVDRREASEQAAGWLERFGLAALAGARPDALSGGQAQRVALARALAVEPCVLLLDEPLSALDASTRVHVRAELRRHLEHFAGARLLVTHDPLDALVLADRLVVLEAGRVTQAGAPADVAARPSTPYVADLLGLNLLLGTRAGEHSVRLDTGAILTVADPIAADLDEVAVAIRPQAVALYRDRPEGSPRNTWRATVTGLDGGADRVRATLAGPVLLAAEVTSGAVAGLGLRPGEDVWATVKAVDIEVYER